MQHVSFEYDCQSERRKDGEVIPLPGGIHVKMYGGENCHFLTVMYCQASVATAVLVSTVVDSTDIPVRKWQESAGPDSFDEWLTKVCREAAEVIMKGQPEELMVGLAAVLLSFLEVNLS